MGFSIPRSGLSLLLADRLHQPGKITKKIWRPPRFLPSVRRKLYCSTDFAALKFFSIELNSLTRYLSPEELEYNEALLSEREEAIREIETTVLEVNEVFSDLGRIVQEQGAMLG